MKKPNVLIYVLDCLRADRLGCFGAARASTPTIDRLSKAAVVVTNAHAQATWTYPSCASIFSGMFPSALGVHTIDDLLPSNIPWLPDVFRSNGFRTSCFSANPIVSAAFGFDRGFDVFTDQFSDSTLSRHRLPFVIQSKAKQKLGRYIDTSDLAVVTSDDLHRAFRSFVDSDDSRPFFSVVWSMDTHDPYFDRDQLADGIPDPLYYQADIAETTDPARRAEYSSLYDRMLSYNDRTLGSLLDHLAARALFDNTVIIVMGDHGESFGEHGAMTHAGRPFDTQTHVPILMKMPCSESSGSTIREPAQLVDIFSTMVRMLSLAHEGGELLQGCPFQIDRPHGNGTAWSEGAGAVSIRSNRWRLMQSRNAARERRFSFLSNRNRGSLHDLLRGSEENRIATARYLPAYLWLSRKMRSIMRHCERVQRTLTPAPRSTCDTETVEDRLRALGYVD